MSEISCPYPGLRPFTEEESIFFKGRDIHIKQIIKQLEDKKIVVVTGASGDGKSSLIYAGVIPHARAGFFRAKFSNWKIADFRPERNPLQNLAASVARHLNMDFETVVKELAFGFSSLVNLYKSSSLYINLQSAEWNEANDKAKKQRRLNAANLLILADQFEELFTNSENYINGKPSSEAYTTVNLLLETAKIAEMEGLPIYIVFTMRSDFISQCVAFKNLPETIAYSNFFVPRLKRNELAQVIEEPAMLAGGSVSKRLVELLINQLHEGFDRLPVLQHALNQLWKLADNGKKQIDILHLAQLGGISHNLLPQNEQVEFNQWFKNIEPFKKQYYELPSMDNILNTHATILYETAFDYFAKNIQWAKKNITKEESLKIIKTAFQCLTKIDQGRAVRNRMSLLEITQIVDNKQISYEEICGVLTVFRLPESTFVRPFIDTNDIATEYLSATAVLDITHEALIRNWKLLRQWNDEEEANVSDLQEFKIQLQRWLIHNKSDDYLLPIGPLSHFEDWYARSKPNKYWLAKYNELLVSNDQKIEQSKQLADDINDYLHRSRKYLTDLELAKRRRRRIVTNATIAIMIILSGLTYWAFRQRSKAVAQTQIAQQQTEIAQKEKNNALEANKIAETERQIAKQRAEEAIFAQLQSDTARSIAEKNKLIAEDKSKIAQEKTILANIETEKARIEKLRADSLRQLAEIQKLKAVVASDSATMLSYLNLAQSLALKALADFDDKNVNMLLALQAYKFNQKFNGKENDPVIYNALRWANSFTDKYKKIDLKFDYPLDFEMLDNENMVVSFANGYVQKTSLKPSPNAELFAYFTDATNAVFYLNSNLAVYSYENQKVYLNNLNTKKRTLLIGMTDFVRGAVICNDYLIVGSRDKSLYFYSLAANNGIPVKTIAFSDRINKLALNLKSNSLFVGLNNGELYRVNVSDFQQTMVHQSNTRLTAMEYNSSKNTLAVGYANGYLRIFNAGEKLSKEILTGKNSIENISFNPSGTHVAISGSNNLIRIYDFQNINSTPLSISEVKQKVSKLKFVSDTKLLALCWDKTIKTWSISNAEYAKNIHNFLPRNFTTDEWNNWVGKDIPYQKTKE